VNGAETALEFLAPENGPWWLKGGTVAECFGEAIGNDDADLVINLDTQELWKAQENTPSLDWAQELLYSLDGTQVMDWDNRQFDGADWTFLAGTICKVEEPAGATAANEGGIQMLGGYSWQAQSYGEDIIGGTVFTLSTLAPSIGSAAVDCALYAHDGTREVWLSDELNCVAAYDGTYFAFLCDSANGGAVVGQDGTQEGRIADTTYAFNAITGGINVNGASSYFFGDAAGKTHARRFTLIDDQGAAVHVKIAGGIMLPD